MEEALIHPANASEAVEMLGAALCQADADRHTGLERETPCPLHLDLAVRTLEALGGQVPAY